MSAPNKTTQQFPREAVKQFMTILYKAATYMDFRPVGGLDRHPEAEYCFVEDCRIGGKRAQIYLDESEQVLQDRIKYVAVNLFGDMEISFYEDGVVEVIEWNGAFAEDPEATL